MSHVLPGEPLVNNFKIPAWAGKPPPGLHLDVMKEGKLIQKLIIDEKGCYFFGRNRQLCDFPVEHQSCSRVHAVLVWHKLLNRAFLIDLGSVHGTFIGKIRLEAHKPQQVPLDSELHFGASSRVYIIRERPNPLYTGPVGGTDLGATNPDGVNPTGPENRLSLDDSSSGTNSLGLLYSQLPQSEVELDNLTEFNTAHNRRIAGIVDVASNPPLGLSKLRKRKSYSVHFSDADEIINPEDVDPSIGRFRNLVQETFIPNKRAKGSHEGASLGVAAPEASESGNQTIFVNMRPTANGTRFGQSGANSTVTNSVFGPTYSLATKLGLPLPNLAPDVDAEPHEPCLPPTLAILHAHAHSRPGTLSSALADGRSTSRLSASDILGVDNEITSGTLDSGLIEPDEPKRKKYAKEAWPGKRPGFLVGPTA
ncbi:hypothetical protein CRM22_004869 [Opisthorchis felineus]|uniref:FHA domain-containing protein n=1 Tax=Opisthorchis felineus TaxID=147828 RepID=A0A4S2LU36_OPIFE|nr:hypothetical protein CRM22_004869 [Opisthorchis felineus]